jgi:hypothetical protein
MVASIIYIHGTSDETSWNCFKQQKKEIKGIQIGQEEVKISLLTNPIFQKSNG